MNDSITVTQNGGTMFSGEKAVSAYRIKMLAYGIKGWAKFKMIPTRGVTISKMLKMATEYTGKKYKNKPEDYAKAEADLNALFTERAAPLVKAD